MPALRGVFWLRDVVLRPAQARVVSREISSRSGSRTLREKETQGIQGAPAHGLAISPDGKTLCVTSKYYGYLAAYSLPGCKLLKVVPVGSHPEWLTIPPGGASLYVATAGNDATVAVDLKTMQVVKKIPVGAVPKRNTSGMIGTD
jgi:YVTN family beta-propeller protein